MSLAGKAQTLLELVVDTAEEASFALPRRRYVAAGTPGSEAHDCDDGQVTVALSQVGGSLAVTQADGVGMSGDAASASLASALFLVQIAFPHPILDDNLPTADELNAAGMLSMEAAEVLERVGARVMTEAPLTGGVPGGVRRGPVTTSGPSGGLAAVNLAIATDLV